MAMTLRLTDAQQEALRATAEREQRSMQAVAAEAIERYTSERNRRRDEILAKIMDRDSELLDRLAQG
jgi:predicted transcriptional regulator